MSKISVIVPVYKVEKYLCRCIDSILSQTYQDMEIILVDDGSPDGCPAICDEYAVKYPQIKVVHKENGGLSSARNAGLAVASGEYIGFVDSDDYILPEMYENLHVALAESSAELSICDYLYVDENSNEPIPTYTPVQTEVLSREQAYHKLDVAMDGYARYVTAWNKLYKRELFDGCLFPEGKLHEDEFFVHHVFEKCTRIAVISDILYMYMQRSGSITNTDVTVKHLDSVYAIHDRYEFFRKKNYQQLAKSLLHSALWKLEALLLKLQGERNVAQVNRAVRLVLKSLICRLDRKAVLLLVYWLRYLLHTAFAYKG